MSDITSRTLIFPVGKLMIYSHYHQELMHPVHLRLSKNCSTYHVVGGRGRSARCPPGYDGPRIGWTNTPSSKRLTACFPAHALSFSQSTHSWPNVNSAWGSLISRTNPKVSNVVSPRHMTLLRRTSIQWAVIVKRRKCVGGIGISYQRAEVYQPAPLSHSNYGLHADRKRDEWISINVRTV